MIKLNSPNPNSITISRIKDGEGEAVYKIVAQRTSEYADEIYLTETQLQQLKVLIQRI